MVYVERDGGHVVAVYANLQPGRAEEELTDDDADVLAFLSPPPDLNDYLADKRYRVETGGIVVPSDPLMTCWTDRATQGMLARTVQLLDKGMLSEPVKVKVHGGFVSLTRAQVEAIGGAVAQHVQACFDIEADLAASIALGNVTTTAEIDAANWPHSLSN